MQQEILQGNRSPWYSFAKQASAAKVKAVARASRLKREAGVPRLRANFSWELLSSRAHRSHILKSQTRTIFSHSFSKQSDKTTSSDTVCCKNPWQTFPVCGSEKILYFNFFSRDTHDV